MSVPVQRRSVRVLVVDASRSSVLVDHASELPAFVIELSDDEATPEAVRRAVLPQLGLVGPLTEILIDVAAARADGDPGPITTLVELPPPQAGWLVPDGLLWAPLSAVEPTIAGSLSAHLGKLLAEHRGIVPVADLRATWSRAGWYEQVVAWAESVLAVTGRPPPTDVVQVRHWGISAVMRVETSDGRYWFKASCPHFRGEAAITAHLDRELPGAVARVIAAETDEGWLLLEDLGGRTLAGEPEPHRLAIERLVAIQKAMAGRTDEVVAAGGVRRELSQLPTAFVAAMAAPVVREWLVVEPDRVHQLTEWLADAVVAIEALGIDDTIVHGDFHPGNVALVDGSPVIFDWSDAAVTNPLMDIAPWSTWFLDDPASVDSLWAMFFDAWSDTVPLAELEALRPTLQGVAGAFHTVSYAGLVAGLEPCRRVESADGLTDFFSLLDAAVPRSPAA